MTAKDFYFETGHDFDALEIIASHTDLIDAESAELIFRAETFWIEAIEAAKAFRALNPPATPVPTVPPPAVPPAATKTVAAQPTVAPAKAVPVAPQDPFPHHPRRMAGN